MDVKYHVIIYFAFIEHAEIQPDIMEIYYTFINCPSEWNRFGHEDLSLDLSSLAQG